jgi:hypothetical protein
VTLFSAWNHSFYEATEERKDVVMRSCWRSFGFAVLLGIGLLAAPAQGATLSLNFSGGSLADPITDSSATDLDVGDLVFIYASATQLDAGDLFSVIFDPLPGGGLAFVDPSSIDLTSSIGAGISPPINLEGRLRAVLNLGDTSAPLRPEGTWLHLIAIDTADLASATEAGISADIFQIPSLPNPDDPPPLPVDFVYGGFATVPIPEPGTFWLVIAGLAALQRVKRPRSRPRA